MDKEDCKRALAEIEAQFLARDSALCWSIARELADFTVAVHPAEEHKREATSKLESFKLAEAVRLAQKSQRVATNSATLGTIN